MKVSELKGKTELLMGNVACVEGAIAAGCDFYAGYPISPANEIMHHMASRFNEMQKSFIQMEDEIASISAVIGASWGGAKAMTATSGPGFSLMMENLGYAYFTETPCVIVDVQRAGPSTGQATRPAQGDVMQVRWGTHGDISPIAFSPWSVQDMYSMSAMSFYFAEKYRMPVIILTDEAIGHLREKVVLHKNMYRIKRKKTKQATFGDPKTNKTTPMPTFGNSRDILVTGSTHDHWGYRRTTDSKVHEKLVKRINEKTKDAHKELPKPEWFGSKKAETLIIAYGISARSAMGTLELLDKNTALLRLPVIWPFPKKEVQRAMKNVKKVVVPELNRGQLLVEVERLDSECDIIPFNQVNGEVILPKILAGFIKKV